MQTAYADLVQQCLDADFDRDYPENGSFYRQTKRGRDYWYYSGYDAAGGKYTKYAGPADDPELTGRVERFRQIKSSYRQRRKIVRALVSAGLPAPEPFTGELLDALARAGLFRLRACLVGSVAYQTYSGILGVELPGALLRTADADLAQFLSISAEVGDSTPPMLEVLRSVDSTFAEIGHAMDARRTIAYRNDAGYRVEFLTPNRGSDDYAGQPPVPRLRGGRPAGKAAARPLRFLDFLIWQPLRAVVLHGAGVAVRVPAPERYAVHKLIVATRRRNADAAKVEKDLAQAAALVEAMAQGRRHDLLDAWTEAWERGEAWRQALGRGRDMLPKVARALLGEAVARAAAAADEDPTAIGFEAADATGA
ncbi:hypothetical protein SAMN06265365_11099 [Tistlia consotensis]|uniref:Nucleotidyltransferase-like domain-containing protein n=2 Tax=Tistlia TaxID=1321364 RepID=A0A1Y6BY94_9PROT|nr:hypothetical protein SAMN05428998_10957 [Tistlia consotensis USBA 355]SNR66487.1 hypothetical protein SAMN06265365_11099 [Tistlia consotensis]